MTCNLIALRDIFTDKLVKANYFLKIKLFFESVSEVNAFL